MTNKAYIVANEQQEREVLEKLEREGIMWYFKSKPTEYVPTRDSYYNIQFPYVLFGDDNVTWGEMSELKDNYEIVFDGRKEEHMSEKYVVSQEFMYELEEWKDTLDSKDYASPTKLGMLPIEIDKWRWCRDNKEKTNRLIAIMRWVNGEDVFEVEKPKKWVVRSKDADALGRYGYLDCYDYVITGNIYERTRATHFDTKEEAQSWANAHQEVVEVVDV